MKMKKRSIVIGLFMMALCFLGLQTNVYAASASVIITAGTADVKKGEKFTVTVVAESSAVIGDFEAYISYDADVLEFDTGGSYVTGGDGLLHILEMGSGNNEAVKQYALQFYAKKDGKCQISVKDRPIVLEADTREEMSVSKNSLSIKVGEGEKKPNNNRKLKSLIISNGTLEPEFSAKKTEYQVTVGSQVDTLFVIAKPDYAQSVVTITGNENLKVGQNTINIEVKSQAGERKNYILYVRKLSQEEEALQQKETIEETPQPEEITEILSVSEQDGNIYLQTHHKYEIQTLEDQSLIPSGYMQTSLVLGGKKVTAYTLKNDLDNDFLLMYLKYEEEEPQFYRYDRKEKTLQRYQKDNKKVAEELNSSNNSMNNQTMNEEEYTKNIFQLTIVIAIETAVCAFLLAAVMRLYLKGRKKETEDDFDI